MSKTQQLPKEMAEANRMPEQKEVQPRQVHETRNPFDAYRDGMIDAVVKNCKIQNHLVAACMDTARQNLKAMAESSKIFAYLGRAWWWYPWTPSKTKEE